ncbi:MAG TPA: hydrogenase nickel incorporation protein HypB [Steroidobacteraceae bacterium]|jgi:hydrogenase nickel incorporation protein HypB
MCELCKLGLASTAGTSADEQGREALTAVGSALVGNDRIARGNKDYLDLHGITAINLLSTPRAGKTSLLESCIPTLQRDYRIGVITSDLASERDIQRLRALRVPTLQVVTGAGRHLDAYMVQRALRDIVTAELDLLFIESDGNLECPASLSLGQHHSVALLSIADGDDRPQREPAIFRGADLVLLTKTDLLDATVRFDDLRLHRNLRAIGCEAPVLGVSNRRGIGIDVVCDWLRAKEALQSLQVASRTPEPQSLLPANPRLRYN